MPKHTRSRVNPLLTCPADGCANCKQKRIKCDENRPFCRNCQDQQVQCPGFARQLQWKSCNVALPSISPKKIRRSSRRRDQALASQSEHDSLDGTGSAGLQAQQNACYTNLRESPTAVPDSHGESPRPTAGVSSSEDSSKQYWEGDDTLQASEHILTPNPHERRSIPESISSAHQHLFEAPGVDLESTLGLICDEASFEMATGESPRSRAQSIMANSGPLFLNEPECEQAVELCLMTPELFNNQECDSSSQDTETKRLLTKHYFDQICRILSCFDSHENPFRADIAQEMLTCDYIYDCVASLSAAHLANSVSSMEMIVLRHQSRALLGLSDVIQTMQSGTNAINFQQLAGLSQRSSIHQALLASLLLGVSSAWYDASVLGLPYLHGARLLFRAWLIDQDLCDYSADEHIALDRRQSFIVGAMAYLECLNALVVDQPLDSSHYLRRFLKCGSEQRVYPNPWTGISTSLFIIFADVGALVKRQRSATFVSTSEPIELCESAEAQNMLKEARYLYKQTLQQESSSTESIEETKDPTTPLEDLVLIHNVYRLVILLELLLAFPRLADEDTVDLEQSGESLGSPTIELATAALSMIFSLPEHSGANIMLAVPLLCAGSALQSPTLRNSAAFDLSSNSFTGLRKKLTPMMWRLKTIQMWRRQVEWQIQHLYGRVGVAPVQRLMVLLRAVWERADAAGVDQEPSHWMTVMVQEKLETVFG
ncbi:hypothetical protein HBI38_172560 [Parastagonospora nodorum]|nr:hypothetical protein HBH50_177670 [Parastagonospora nodorum]KAH4084255.1 hypothetical protein HBH48_166820 [Parastagonospora nodorum]KAH4402501.1 hypothetical protein HBH92_209200 [Parastagonospora nodorum]KAH4427915.1 hypothetical protein HBH93_163020 [Parastagonospora nodorum]KAH4438181.1 hypothetical protein HBH91_186830 [Parastagonospora nodorum]